MPGFGFDSARAAALADGDLAHLWMVPNAAHHASGDFALTPAGRLVAEGAERLTWASIGLFRAEMFADIPVGTRLALRPRLDAAIDAGRLGGSRWDGAWTDVGTAERWAALDATP